MSSIEEAEKFIADELRKQLEHFIGEPCDPDKVRMAVRDALTPIYKSLGILPQEVESKVLSEILVVGFLGMPEDFDPKSLLESVSNRTLGLLVDRLGQAGFPGNLFGLEWSKRQGNILDWSFHRENAQAANLSVIPKFSIVYVDPDGGPKARGAN